MAFKYRFVIAVCARWETRYVVEWLNYHRAIGFEHVYLYCNDDDPRALYEAVLPFTMGPAPFVTFRFFPEQGEQRKMLLHFLAQDRHQAEWICFLDLDEFIRLPKGRDLERFMAPFEPIADCVMFNWVFFGPNGHVTPPRGNVLEMYTRRDAGLHPLTKLIARSFIFDDPKLYLQGKDASFIHRLGEYVGIDIRAVNVLGEDMTDYYVDFHRDAKAFVNQPARREAIFAKAVIHHYAFRLEQAFTDRVARGLKGDFGGQTLWGDLRKNEGFFGFVNGVNAVEDRRLADFWRGMINKSRLTNVAPGPRGDLLSLGKPATQSSVSPLSCWPVPEEDAAGAVNGEIDGSWKFHTGLEDNPWWQVDLGGIATIREIHLYNTSGHVRDCFKNFNLAVSIDGTVWVEIFVKQDDAALADVLFIWSGPGFAWARYVRVTRLDRGHLHLNQVEVFGQLR